MSRFAGSGLFNLSALYSPTVFISHKKEDKDRAKSLKERLEAFGLVCYLDVDDLLNQMLLDSPVELTANLDEQLQKCDTLLAVVSDKTIESWWVPYEIGYVRALARPVAVYDWTICKKLPEYLHGWPKFWRTEELAVYVQWVKERCSKVELIRKSLELNKGMTKTASANETASILEDELRTRLHNFRMS